MKHIYIFILLLILVIISCADPIQEIEWKTDSIPAKLVFEGSVTTDSAAHPIRLSLSDDYFSNKPTDNISDAQITLSDGISEINYVEDEDAPGYYYPTEAFAAKIGKEYNLEINLPTPVDGKTEFTAKTDVIQGFEIDSVEAQLFVNPYKQGNDEFKDDTLSVIVIAYGLEPANNKNYYMIKFYRNDTIVSDTVTHWGYFNDNESNGSSYFGLILNEQFKGDDTLKIELFSVEESYYHFLEGLRRISQSGDPFEFSGPTANAVGNINDGEELGFFFAAHKTTGTAIVQDQTK